MTFGDFIKIIKKHGKIAGSQEGLVIDLLAASFGFDSESISNDGTDENPNGLTDEQVKKWISRDDSPLKKWIYKINRTGKTFDHSAFINFLSARIVKPWTDVQTAFKEKVKEERNLIDCDTNESGVFWLSVLWQFKSIVGLAQDDDMSASNEYINKQVNFDNLPCYVSTPFLFMSIKTNRRNNSAIYVSAYEDKSTVVLSGQFDRGKYLVISFSDILTEPSNPLRDIQSDLVDTLYELLKTVGSNFPQNKIGISCAHKEAVSASCFNRVIKSKLEADGIGLYDTSVATIGLCDIFIIAEPQTDFSEEEEEEILSFIANGGTIVFCSNGWRPKFTENGQADGFERTPISHLGKLLGFTFEKQQTGVCRKYKNHNLYFTPIHRTNSTFYKNLQSADLKSLFNSANSGDSDAQWQLGYQFEIGEDLPKDPLKALYWYKMSAFQDNAMGQHKLSRCYMGIISVLTKNDILTLIWLKRSAQKRNMYALGNLGNAYKLGLYGLNVDSKAAIAFTEASAKEGWALAQFRHGKYCESKRDFKNAVLWYNSALQSDRLSVSERAETMLRLSLLYISGKGTPINIKKAKSLLHIAASLGNKKAEFELEELVHKIEIGEIKYNSDDDIIGFYNTKIFEGTMYALFSESEKQTVLFDLNEIYATRLNSCFKEILGEKSFDELCNIQENVEYAESEIERLKVKNTIPFRIRRSQLPQIVSDEKIAQEVLPVIWLFNNCPDYLEIIENQKKIIINDLRYGILNLPIAEELT